MKKIITLICLLISIQTYKSSAQAWTNMANGLGASNEEIKAVAVDPSGNIYVGGTFTGAISYIAKWNGSGWVGLGQGVNGPVYSIGIRTASDIYVGGQFTTAGGISVENIARWNGSVWNSLGSGFNGKVLCVYTPGSGTIYAGGEFTMSGTANANHIAKYVGTTWTAMGNGIPSNVNSIVEHNNSVYAGCDQSSNPVMNFNGSTWSGVTGLTGGKALSLASFGGMLYAGGDFSTPIRALAKHDGTGWSTAVTNFNFGQKVNVLLTRTDALYVGGNFDNIGIGTPNYIARIPNISAPLLSFTVSSELVGGEVFAIGKSAGKVVAGGRFTTPTSPVTNNIAITTTTIDVNELSDIVINRSLYPNPAHGKTTLSLSTNAALSKPEIKIFDVQSKLIKVEVSIERSNNDIQFHLNLQNIPAGNYYYVVTENGKAVTSDIFIIE